MNLFFGGGDVEFDMLGFTSCQFLVLKKLAFALSDKIILALGIFSWFCLGPFAFRKGDASPDSSHELHKSTRIHQN